MFSIFRYIFSRTILVFSSQHPMNCEKKLFCIRMVTNDIETNNIFWLSLIKHKNILYNLSVYLRQPCHLNTLPSNGMRFIFFPDVFAIRSHESFDKNSAFSIYLTDIVADLCSLFVLCDPFYLLFACCRQIFARWRWIHRSTIFLSYHIYRIYFTAICGTFRRRVNSTLWYL